MHTAALIASDGSMDWACLPYFDSPAVFCRLLDRRSGGYCAIRLPDGAKTSRKYIEGTNILETTFTTLSGTVAVADFMPVQAHHDPEERNPRIIRLARCTSGHVDIAFECKPGPGFQRSSARFQALTAEIIEVKAEAQDLLMERPNLSVRRDTVFATANLHAGETAFFAITYASQAAQLEFLDVHSACVVFEETRRYWAEWLGRLRYEGGYRDEVLRSILLLKLLTFAPPPRHRFPKSWAEAGTGTIAFPGSGIPNS